MEHNDANKLTRRGFGMAMAQQLDIEIDLPGAGAFPVLALREGAREWTGIILATSGAELRKIDGMMTEFAVSA